MDHCCFFCYGCQESREVVRDGLNRDNIGPLCDACEASKQDINHNNNLSELRSILKSLD